MLKMFLIKDNDEFILETYKDFEELLTPDEINFLKKLGVKLNRLPPQKVVQIRFKQNISPAQIGQIIIVIMNRYGDRR